MQNHQWRFIYIPMLQWKQRGIFDFISNSFSLIEREINYNTNEYSGLFLNIYDFFLIHADRDVYEGNGMIIKQLDMVHILGAMVLNMKVRYGWYKAWLSISMEANINL